MGPGELVAVEITTWLISGKNKCRTCNNWFIACIIYSKARRVKIHGDKYVSRLVIFSTFVFRRRLTCLLFEYAAEILGGGEAAAVRDF